jgi:uncharacterized membrane protein YedE/YeeE
VPAGVTATAATAPASGRLKAGGILLLAALASIAYLAVDLRFVYLLSYAWFGLVYGILLQYGRFCMASAVRDLFAVGVPRMAVGVLLAVMLYAIVSACVQAAGFGLVHPHPLGWHILAGGVVFGLGMVLAGGCASSTLYKSGEGNIGSMLVLVSIAFSQAWVVSAGGWLDRLVPAGWHERALSQDMPEELSVGQGWFDQFTAGHLWDLQGQSAVQLLGWANGLWSQLVGNALLVALLPSFLLLCLLYRYNYRRIHLRDHAPQGQGKSRLRYELGGLWTMFTQSRNTAWAGLGLGLFAGLQMLVVGWLQKHYQVFNFGELLARMGYVHGLSLQDTVFDPGYWYITTQEAQWGGWILDKLGMNITDNIFFGLENGIPNPLINAPGMMSVGIILGAAMLANLSGEFKWKWPNPGTAILAIVGGFLMGIGARLALGCNIGAFFATVTNGDPSGWVFLAGMAAGGWVAVRAIRYWIEWRLSRETMDF